MTKWKIPPDAPATVPGEPADALACIRYLRAENEKLRAERDAALAQVAMAYDVVKASIKKTVYRLGDHPDIRRIMAPQVMWGAGHSCIMDIAKITPADASAALAAMLAEARAEGIREAATMGHAHADIHTRNAVRRAILALIPQQKDAKNASQEK